MSAKTIVILGGGIGGLVTANELRRKLSNEHRVILVEENSEHAFAPSFLWLMTGNRQVKEISKPVCSLVRRGVEIIHAKVEKIDIPNLSVITTEGSLIYDYLAIALGAELVPEIIRGLEDIDGDSGEVYSFYSFEETKRLQRAIAEFDGGKVVILVCSVPYKCPGAPHEGAMLIADYFKQQALRDKMDIHIYTPEPQPMPVAGPELGKALEETLSSKGIAFHPLHKIISVDRQKHQLFFEGKEPVSYDLMIIIPPHRAPCVVRDANLTNETGWIPVDRYCLKTKFENVYAIGDVTSISIPGRWRADVPMMLPKAGVFAHAQAEIVAERIADEIDGRSGSAEFCGNGYCILEAGEGLAGFAFGDFFAEPSPKVELRNFSRMWHFGKVLFEKWWLSPFGIKKSVLRTMLELSSKIFKIPV